jgi:fructose/tagatose bisphosphate aldolase
MMEVFNTSQEMKDALKDVLSIDERGIKVIDEKKLCSEAIDKLVYTAVFSEEANLRQQARRLIRLVGEQIGIVASSIHDLYMAMGRGETPQLTVPAMNIRCMTYDVARRVFRIANELKAGAFIFEIARSEMGYTKQSPFEYATSVLAAAIREDYRGPVFIQGDHFQINSKLFVEQREKELDNLKALIREAIAAGFYNIDIDASTVVDYSRPSLTEQQYLNYLCTAQLTAFIREIEPEGITVSVGAEIGHIGGKNSTVEEAEAFMEGFLEHLQGLGASLSGISKLSVQTGTTHGGVPLPDGSIAEVRLDFSVLRDIGSLVRSRYGLSGTVQHGASTLPEEFFDLFPDNNCSEIHLATGFQNIMFDYAPEEFRNEIYEFLKNEYREEWKEDMTEEQFIYKTRKKAFGHFKKQWWSLDETAKEKILDALEEKFRVLFQKLRVEGTKELVERYTKLVKVGYPVYEETGIQEDIYAEGSD